MDDSTCLIIGQIEYVFATFGIVSLGCTRLTSIAFIGVTTKKKRKPFVSPNFHDELTNDFAKRAC